MRPIRKKAKKRPRTMESVVTQACCLLSQDRTTSSASEQSQVGAWKATQRWWMMSVWRLPSFTAGRRLLFEFQTYSTTSLVQTSTSRWAPARHSRPVSSTTVTTSLQSHTQSSSWPLSSSVTKQAWRAFPTKMHSREATCTRNCSKKSTTSTKLCSVWTQH